MFTFVLIGLFGVLFVVAGMIIGADDGGIPGVVIGVVMCFTGMIGVSVMDEIEEDRQRPVGAWCTDAGGTYHSNGIQMKLQTQDGSAIVIAAPTCIYPEVP
jgi:hypothetical protein